MPHRTALSVSSWGACFADDDSVTSIKRHARAFAGARFTVADERCAFGYNNICVWALTAQGACAPLAKPWRWIRPPGW